MPNIMTIAEAEYNAIFQEYQIARKGFYDGTVSTDEFIRQRKALDAALAVWERDRIAA